MRRSKVGKFATSPARNQCTARVSRKKPMLRPNRHVLVGQRHFGPIPPLLRGSVSRIGAGPATRQCAYSRPGELRARVAGSAVLSRPLGSGAEKRPAFGPPVSGDAWVALGWRFGVLQRQRGASPAANQDTGLICTPPLTGLLITGMFQPLVVLCEYCRETLSKSPKGTVVGGWRVVIFAVEPAYSHG